MVKVLGIESSCDETSVAILDDRRILSNIVISQIEQHKKYGGVVPELSSRNHLQLMPQVLELAFDKAKIGKKDIDAVAVTAGPGLIGGLLVGIMFAKAISSVLNKPLLPINHLEGHALSPRITSQDLEFPYLLLLISGGHCQILEVLGVGKFVQLGSTIDDAVGESFDKVARMLELEYPGGPKIEKLAREGDHLKYSLPRPLINEQNCNFSFSGLKTAVSRMIEKLKAGRANLTHKEICDICASFQYAVLDVLSHKIRRAMGIFAATYKAENRKLVIAGGVAANQYLRQSLEVIAQKAGFALVTPPMELCTDNAAMIAWAGVEHFNENHTYSKDFQPRSRWPLTALS
jgi:N6-L-threonylcarbamoyladenine synthase